MEFKNLYTFLRVAELGSFTKAAASLNYAQSTVTMQIKQLEEEIGVPLFERIGRNISLTNIGEELVQYSNAIMHLEDQIKAINISSPTATGSLKIGVVESLMSTMLIPVMSEFCRRFPSLRIEVRQAISSTLIDMLQHNEIDIAFIMGQSGYARDCVCAASHTERAVFFCNNAHPLAHKANVTLSEIFEYDIILTGESSFMQRALQDMAFLNNCKPKSYIQCESSRVILDLVHLDLGIAYLPEYAVKTSYYRDEFHIVQADVAPHTFYTSLLYHKNKWITPQMAGIIEMMKSQWQPAL